MQVCSCKADIATLSSALALLLAFLVTLKLFLNTDVSISISFTSSFVLVFSIPFVGLSFLGWVLRQQGMHRNR